MKWKKVPLPLETNTKMAQVKASTSNASIGSLGFSSMLIDMPLGKIILKSFQTYLMQKYGRGRGVIMDSECELIIAHYLCIHNICN